MAEVKIADIYNPETYGRRVQQAQLQFNRFLSSGVAYRDPDIARQLREGALTGEMTNFPALATAEPTYASDDPDSDIVPKKISSEKQSFRLADRNEAWSTMDLAVQLAAQDPAQAIINRIGQFWAQDDEQRILATLTGILNDNDANDSDDMIINVANDNSAAVTDAQRISGSRVIQTLQTLGDHKSEITTIAMHSTIHARLQQQNLIVYNAPTEGNIGFETYLGKRLIVDDSMPATMGTNRMTYTCILFGGALFANANGRVTRPSEMYRKPLAGHGSGQDIIISRVANVWHPIGFNFVGGTVSGNNRFATYANLRLAANWNRVWERKNIPLAFLRIND